jgi:GGDEF domain-containing protein
MDRFSRQYSREIYGKKNCSTFMNPNPLIADKNTPITELSQLVINKGRATFMDGFILTDNGRYLGLGSGYDLIHEISEMQIVAARYANPLTMLPGNVPIAEHTERLMDSNAAFCAAYFDLDNFKPYNDVYGFRRGDAVIQFTASILCKHVHPEMDFVGHIGGDDFFVLFQSADWEQRCLTMLTEFDSGKSSFFQEEHLAQGGYSCEDRRGNMVQYPLFSLSIGALYVKPCQFQQYQEIFSAASVAKRMAKRTAGSSLFIEQRGLDQPQIAICPA